jgi:hypothetical protein
MRMRIYLVEVLTERMRRPFFACWMKEDGCNGLRVGGPISHAVYFPLLGSNYRHFDGKRRGTILQLVGKPYIRPLSPEQKREGRYREDNGKWQVLQVSFP